MLGKLQTIKNPKANVPSEMKGERLQIKISEVSQLAKGTIITGKILSGRLSLNQNVFLHNTTNGKPISCIIVDIRVNDRFVSQAKKNSNFTSYILGPHLGDYIIGQSYISSLSQPKKEKVKTEEVAKFEDTAQRSVVKVPKTKNPIDNIVTERVHPNSSINAENLKSNIVAAEKEIIDCINHCLADGGSLSATEKYVIYKIAEVHNISKSQCEKILSKTLKSFDENKSTKIFSDAVKSCLLDSNYISESELYLLSKLRDALNISESIAHDIIYHFTWRASE